MDRGELSLSPLFTTTHKCGSMGTCNNQYHVTGMDTVSWSVSRLMHVFLFTIIYSRINEREGRPGNEVVNKHSIMIKNAAIIFTQNNSCNANTVQSQ